MKLEIDGEEVESKCYNCGETIHLCESEPFMVCFDPGEPQTRNHPGAPAVVFLSCYDCAKEGL